MSLTEITLLVALVGSAKVVFDAIAEVIKGLIGIKTKSQKTEEMGEAVKEIFSAAITAMEANKILSEQLRAMSEKVDALVANQNTLIAIQEARAVTPTATSAEDDEIPVDMDHLYLLDANDENEKFEVMPIHHGGARS